MKKVILFFLLAIVSIACTAQFKITNNIVQQTAGGDTLLTIIKGDSAGFITDKARFVFNKPVTIGSTSTGIYKRDTLATKSEVRTLIPDVSNFVTTNTIQGIDELKSFYNGIWTQSIKGTEGEPINIIGLIEIDSINSADGTNAIVINNSTTTINDTLQADNIKTKQIYTSESYLLLGENGGGSISLYGWNGNSFINADNGSAIFNIASTTGSYEAMEFNNQYTRLANPRGNKIFVADTSYTSIFNSNGNIIFTADADKVEINSPAHTHILFNVDGTAEYRGFTGNDGLKFAADEMYLRGWDSQNIITSSPFDTYFSSAYTGDKLLEQKSEGSRKRTNFGANGNDQCIFIEDSIAQYNNYSGGDFISSTRYNVDYRGVNAANLISATDTTIVIYNPRTTDPIIYQDGAGNIAFNGYASREVFSSYENILNIRNYNGDDFISSTQHNVDYRGVNMKDFIRVTDTTLNINNPRIESDLIAVQGDGGVNYYGWNGNEIINYYTSDLSYKGWQGNGGIYYAPNVFTLYGANDGEVIANNITATSKEITYKDAGTDVLINSVLNETTSKRKLYINNGDGQNPWFISDSTGINTINDNSGDNSIIFADDSIKFMQPTNLISTTHYAYGGIYINDGTATQSIPSGSTYTKVTPFLSSDNVYNITTSTTTDDITCIIPGIYRAEFNTTFQMSTATNTRFAMFKTPNGGSAAEMNNVHGAMRPSSSSDVVEATGAGFIYLAVGDKVDLRTRHDNGSAATQTILYSNMTLNLIRAY